MATTLLIYCCSPSSFGSWTTYSICVSRDALPTIISEYSWTPQTFGPHSSSSRKFGPQVHRLIGPPPRQGTPPLHLTYNYMVLTSKRGHARLELVASSPPGGWIPRRSVKEFNNNIIYSTPFRTLRPVKDWDQLNFTVCTMSCKHSYSKMKSKKVFWQLSQVLRLLMWLMTQLLAPPIKPQRTHLHFVEALQSTWIS